MKKENQPITAKIALKKALDIFYQLLPIFLFIILIMTLTNYFLKPKQIIKHFGKVNKRFGYFFTLPTLKKTS